MTSISRHKGWWELVLLVALSVPFLFWGLGSIDLLDPDEGMYGSIAREMAEGRDWVTPHFNGVRYLEKPPLYFWLTAFMTATFGPSEWAVRLGSALPALGTAVLTWDIGRLLYGGLAGLLSAIIFLTGVGVFRYARVAATDFLLVFSLTLTMYAFVKSYWSMVNGHSSMVNRELVERRRTIGQLPMTIDCAPALFWLGMALGVLSKGLIGFVLPLLVVGLFLLAGKLGGWEARKPSSLLAFQPIYSPFGIFLFLALTLPWHLLAVLKNPGFFEFYVLDNQFLRFLNSRSFLEDDVPVTTFAFLLLTLVWFFPWSLFLPAAWRQGFPRLSSLKSPSERFRLLVGLWAFIILGFFFLSSSKLEHYFLPTIPPLSLMVGALWSEAVGRRSSMVNGYGLLRWCLGVGAGGGAVVGLALIFFSSYLTPQALLAGLGELNVYYRILRAQGFPFPFASVTPFVQLLQWLGIVLLLGLPLAFLLFHFHMPKASFVAVLCVSGMIAALVFKLLLIIEPHHSAKAVAMALETRAHPGDAIVHEGPLEYTGGLPFYIGRQIYLLNGRRGDLDFGSHYEETRHLFLDREEFARLWANHKRVFLVTRDQNQDSVLRYLPEEKGFLIGQFGSRWLYTNHKQLGSEEAGMLESQKKIQAPQPSSFLAF